MSKFWQIDSLWISPSMSFNSTSSKFFVCLTVFALTSQTYNELRNNRSRRSSQASKYYSRVCLTWRHFSFCRWSYICVFASVFLFCAVGFFQEIEHHLFLLFSLRSVGIRFPWYFWLYLIVVDLRMSQRKSFLRHKKHSTWRDVSNYEARRGTLISGFGDNHHRLRDSRKLGMLMWIVLMAASVGNHLSVQRAVASDAMRSHLVPTLMELSGYLQSSELRTLGFQNREIMNLVTWHVSLRDISRTQSRGHI